MGVRQHFLRFVPNETWRHQNAAGFAHDSTLGFADMPGFRAGTCRDFPVFDLRERTPLPLVERPLVVMDATLFAHLRLGVEEATRRAAQIVDACRDYGGSPVILYHNSMLSGRRSRIHYADVVNQITR